MLQFMPPQLEGNITEPLDLHLLRKEYFHHASGRGARIEEKDAGFHHLAMNDNRLDEHIPVQEDESDTIPLGLEGSKSGFVQGRWSLGCLVRLVLRGCHGYSSDDSKQKGFVQGQEHSTPPGPRRGSF